MSVGLGNIKYTNRPGASNGFINVAGARNGNSVDSLSFIVLGQNVGAAGNPAILLNNREIPGAGFQLNLFNGNLVVSAAGQIGAGERVGIYDTLGAGITKNILRLAVDLTAAGAIPSFIHMDATVTAPPGLTTSGRFLEANVNGNTVFASNLNGITLFNLPTTGASFVGIQSIPSLLGPLSGAATINITGTYNATVPIGLSLDIACQSSFVCAGGSAGFTLLLMRPGINQTAGGTGAITGIDFQPSVTSVTGQVIFLNGQIGDVLLQRGGTSGRTGIQGISVPTAWLQIGAGKAAVGSAPLKINVGVLLTVVEQGALEYDATGLYFTKLATRQAFFLGNSGATAPALTATPVFTSFYGGNTNALGDPNSWAAVTLGGTVFKVPLYT